MKDHHNINVTATSPSNVKPVILLLLTPFAVSTRRDRPRYLFRASAAPVILTIRHGDKAVTLEAVDHGTGIPFAEQRHQVPGFGLGLSIAHRIAQIHNGDLSVITWPGEMVFCLTVLVSIEGVPT